MVAETADDVAVNWEAIKRAEKGRSSVTEGIPAALPALLRYVKLRRTGRAVGLVAPTGPEALDALDEAVDRLRRIDLLDVDDADSATAGAAFEAVGLLLGAAGDLSAGIGVDPEMALRRRADDLAGRIIETESA